MIFVSEIFSKIYFLYINPYTKIRQNGPKWSNSGVKKVLLLNASTDHADFFIKARGPGGLTLMRNSGP